MQLAHRTCKLSDGPFIWRWIGASVKSLREEICESGSSLELSVKITRVIRGCSPGILTLIAKASSACAHPHLSLTLSGRWLCANSMRPNHTLCGLSVASASSSHRTCTTIGRTSGFIMCMVVHLRLSSQRSHMHSPRNDCGSGASPGGAAVSINSLLRSAPSRAQKNTR